MRLCHCGKVGLYVVGDVVVCRAHRKDAQAAAIARVRFREVGFPDKERDRKEFDQRWFDRRSSRSTRRYKA